MKILIITQDKELASSIQQEYQKLNIDTVYTPLSLEAIELHKQHKFDIIICELEMSQIDGITLMKELKKIKNIPVVILSSRTSQMDVLYAYEQGCADYIRKPIIAKELAYKVRNYLSLSNKNHLEYGGIEIDTEGRRLLVDGIEKMLTQKEFQLLTYLAKNQGSAISREKLLTDVWGYDFYGDDRTIDTHIKMLRNSLGPYKDYIQTYRGFGYKFEVK